MGRNKYWIIPIGVIILLFIFLWIIKTPVMAMYLSGKLKTDVKISSISISGNQMTIKGFKLKNPRGSKSKYAFTTNKIEVNYSFKKLLSNPSFIDSITVADIFLDIECKNPLCTKNNWTTIVDNINQKEKKSPSKREVNISTLTFENIDVQISGFGIDFMKTKKKHISHISFNNVNSKDGFPTKELIKAIFGSVGLQDYLKGILDVKGKIDNILSPFTDLEDSEGNCFEESLKAL